MRLSTFDHSPSHYLASLLHDQRTIRQYTLKTTTKYHRTTPLRLQDHRRRSFEDRPIPETRLLLRLAIPSDTTALSLISTTFLSLRNDLTNDYTTRYDWIRLHIVTSYAFLDTEAFRLTWKPVCDSETPLSFSRFSRFVPRFFRVVSRFFRVVTRF